MKILRLTLRNENKAVAGIAFVAANVTSVRAGYDKGCVIRTTDGVQTHVQESLDEVVELMESTG